MNNLLVISTLLGALAAGVISPGPSFLMVAQTSVASSRRAGMAAAFGMGAAAALLALIALIGLHAVLSNSAWLTMALQVLGGCYLLYLASKIWQSASTPLALSGEENTVLRNETRSFGLAFVTMLSNPKAAVQYGVIFAALLPREISFSLSACVVALVFLLESGWYVVVAFVLSSHSPKSAYLTHKPTIDRIAAVVMALLGLRLLVAVFRFI
jgi:threonine/homoserine/homoserine lactone efflux protein